MKSVGIQPEGTVATVADIGRVISDRNRAKLQASVLHERAKAVVARAIVVGTDVLVPRAEFTALAQAVTAIADSCPECGSELSEWGPIVADKFDSRGFHYEAATGGEFRCCTACEHREERGPVRVPLLRLGQGEYTREYNATGGRGLEEA